MKQMEQFLRIAKARLNQKYSYKKQRDAIAAKMYVRWLKRQDETFNTKRNERHAHRLNE